MATYYKNHSDIQAAASPDGLQTLILMNPTTPYSTPHLGSYSSDTSPQHHHLNNNNNNNNNVFFLNSVLSHVSVQQQQQQLVGIPLDSYHPSNHEIAALHHAFAPRAHYNMYWPGMDPDARDVARSQQGGLSLSLRASGGSASSPGSGVLNKADGGGKVMSSRYLRAAQELLDEVVSVGREVVEAMVAREESAVGGEGGGREGGGRERERGEMSPAEKQEAQRRKAKLVGMLDEVEQRYRQYHHQMQIVVSWFEQATGIGSAKAYTALALQTISKQFRCLKDAISSQIRASSKSLGEEDSSGGGKNEGSGLKFVDHQIRQQRALQQLGMIQPNAWRPQRGLPERSVSVLRAWLFEHFLHPYPKDSDKIMLAKQTGLTRSQVSNWFINARVRLWKPMVEEMYMEEIKDQEQNGSNDKTTKSENNCNGDSTSKITTHQESTPATENQNANFKSTLDITTKHSSPPVISASPSPTGVNIQNQAGFTLIRSKDMDSISQVSPKKQKNAELLQSTNSYLANEQFSMKFDDERQNRESFTLMGGPTNFIGGFGAYPIGEIGRFGADQFPTTYSGNGVSLSLGLPHGENLSLSGAHQNFLENQSIHIGRRLEIDEPNDFSTINTSTPHSSVAYESINIQNRKRFATQLLPDFVT